MSQLAGLHHVALTVSDLDVSTAWYKSVLGMTEYRHEEAPDRRAVVLALPGTQQALGLVEHGGAFGDTFDPIVTGLDHLAFSVGSQEDMRAWALRLSEAGVEHSGPIEIPPGEILNFKDPDGIALALFWHRAD